MSSQEQPSSIILPVPEILRNDIVQLDVSFINFNGEPETGSIEVHKSIAEDIRDVFVLMYEMSFPLRSVIPIEHFDMSDDRSMASNNSYAFCFRTVALKPHELSLHAYGHAIDLNPLQNPYINGTTTLPKEGTYRKEAPGTFYPGHPVVTFFKDRGFVWGGDWDKAYVDYHHFHKPLPEALERKYHKEVSALLVKQNPR